MNIKKQFLLALSILMITPIAWAGNKDRSGQAGAGELLINPWAASNGLFALNVANVRGVEAMKNNIAGLAANTSTEIGLAHCRYLSGSGMGISNFAVAQPVGKDAVLGLNVMTFSFGDITTTTVDNPTGGIGTFKPTFFNATLGYSRRFSKSMSAGIGFTFVNEAVTNVRASALGIDAGVQYQTGKNDAFKLGITLRNVGTDLRFSGGGFKFNGNTPNGSNELTVQFPSEKFQLPSQLSIGASYDIYLDENKKELDEEGNPIENSDYVPQHRLTMMGSFKSNSFSKDWIGLGAEYAYSEKLFLRAAYRYEADIISETDNTTFYSGLAAGIGFKTDFGKTGGVKIAFDYGYNHTRFNSGNHTVGLRIFFGSADEEEVIELSDDE